MTTSNNPSIKRLDRFTMMKPVLITRLYFSLFLHMTIVTILMVAGDSPPVYRPVENITVKCGYSGYVFNVYDKRNWRGDINSEYSPLEVNTSMFRKAPPSYTSIQVPYTTARLSHSEFTYRFFNLSAGQKFVRLYFYAASYPDFDPSKALFSVKAGRFILLNDFNASVTASVYGWKGSISREFCMNIEEEEKSFNITFSPSRAIPDAHAFINGIEIVSMPPNLYYTDPKDTYGIEYVDSETDFRIENSTALEMVYRINIGGKPVHFDKDTGMYRNWDGQTEDEKYLEEQSLMLSVLPQNVSIQLNFTSKPPYSAPKEVYQTARSMGNNAAVNKRYNLTWQFPVDSNFVYLVRLHFCEFQPNITEVGDQVFLIYMEDLVAEETADIIEWSQGNGIPTYRDYAVFVHAGSAGKKKVNISIALQANPHDWRTLITDAMLNGLEIFKLNTSIGNLAGPNPDPLPTTPTNATSLSSVKSKSKWKTSLLAIVAGVVSVAIVVLSVLGLLLVFRRQRKVKDYGSSSRGAANSTKSGGSSLPSNLCQYFSLAEIKAATQNFDSVFIIGVGGFGHVYKGNINTEGRVTPVAIKRLKPESSQGQSEFKAEIEMLSQLRHRHLVSLIGYCTEEGEMILVYDYMARGTLGDHLYHTDDPPLPWDQRLQICIGAARGLHYLHTGVKYTIIHRDVKSSNILLDEKWVAKVSDFGLSKMGSTTMSNTHISTMVKGSFGYLDPEYFRRQQLTEKSDVYSFGVVLCEVLCARPAFLRTAEKKQMSLAGWAKSCHCKGTLDEIIDPSLKDKIGSACFDKYVEIAMSCLHDNGIERPSMNDVVWGLEFALQLHHRTQGDNSSDLNVERKDEEEVAFMKDRYATGFSSSWEELSNSMTKTSSSEQNSTTNESIKGMSRIIFSGINDCDGR